MTQLNYRFFYLIISIFFIATSSTAQSVNLDETWKEFLDNNKISNMSALNKPNKYDDPLDYIRYLLMNTNTSFCQSDVEKAEGLITEIRTIDPKAFDAVPGFLKKMEDLEAKIKAYYSMDDIWQRFLQTQKVDLKELDAIKAAKTSCEKSTLAKYSYMTVYAHYCRGDIPKAKDILENRTLRLTEKTSLRVEDVEGLGEEVAKMKLLFQNITKLQTNWNDFIESGVSPGFTTELPLFPCNPIPNMKEWLLKGAADVCNAGPKMLEKIKKLEVESGVSPDGELAEKIEELAEAIELRANNLKVLNKAWTAFLPNNEVKKEDRKYGFDYCSKESLIRAYILEGFANVCGNAAESLEQIEAIRKSGKLRLNDVTKTKIEDLSELNLRFQYDADEINKIWNKFVSQGDTLYVEHELADYYCDHIYDVKSWIIKGLSGTCKEGGRYLEQIDEYKRTLEFEFTPDVKCRVNKLRIRVWDCQNEALSKLAKVQATPDNPFETRLESLREEYGIGERPEVCIE